MHAHPSNKDLYEAAKAYERANLSEIFSESDLICVIGQSGEPYYVSAVSNAFAAYKGEAGLTGYLALAFSDEEDPAYEAMELDLAQQCLLAIFTEDQNELESEDRKALTESGVSFDGAVPQFRFKKQYHHPWYIDEDDRADLTLIMQALVYAKEYFAQYGKTKQSDSMSRWLDALGLQESEAKEYVPCLEREGESFAVTARVLQDEAYGFVFPQAFFTNEERQLHFKRMKAQPGKILYYITGILPNPLMGSHDVRPVYPAFALAYDPQTDQILNVSMVEDYEREHPQFVGELLALFEERGKVQAIHCYGKRTLPLLEKIGPQMGVMVVDGVSNAQVDQLVFEMFDELFDGHDHGPHEDHDHDH
ncbi:MAG: hypothetical protein GX938_04350 [Spirochaetales bacterium]|nr:hypothetical protein [Spirochaetales bacterium]